jgi:hypothetical protein
MQAVTKLGPALLRVLVAITVIILLVLFFSNAGTLNSRYQKYRTNFNMTYQMDGERNIVIVGSSRFRWGLHAEKLAEGLSERIGEDVVVQNYAKPGRDLAFDYVLLRDLLKQDCVDTFIVELNIADSAEGRREHFNFFRIATYGDLYESYMGDEYYSIWTRGQLFLKEAFHKSMDTSYRYLKGENNQLKAGRASKARTVEFFVGNTEPTKNFEFDPKYVDSWDWDEPINSRQIRYMKKIKELAAENGVQVYFVHIPWVRGTPDQASIDASEALTGRPVFMPPQDLMMQIYDRRGWRDQKHVNEIGREMITDWLAGKLYAENPAPGQCTSPDAAG